ncbi:SDR family oxidoreductase [Sphingobacterium chungjuense]|uniref:SDR family oxidoreductase n=1 Tax=Sphingobacterium chungjuense TaxID=2675553 RepID=UPI00140D2C7B|nr:SDR family oxidoreductase [Sphingobacterium chungjuense]
MEKKIVLITGTNSGFGWLMAHSVAALGHHVYAAMRDTKGKNADKAAALSAVENVTVLDVSITDEQSVKEAVSTILSTAGHIDILVNNAGTAVHGVTESFTSEDLQAMFDVNFFAPWRFIKQVLPAMRNQSEGLIINISSGFGRISFPFTSMYSASKFALEGMSEGLHYELRPLGIDVAMIEPGAFPTEMQQKDNVASDTAVYAGYGAIEAIPSKMNAAIGSLMEKHQPNPQAVADAVVHLIGLQSGTRPLRTVVDPITGKFIEAANQATAEEFKKGMTLFGLGELLY